VPVENVARVSFLSGLQTSAAQIVNSFHVTGMSDIEPTKLNAMADYLATAGAGTLRNAYCGMMGSGSALKIIEVAQVKKPNDASDLVVEVQRSINAAGTLAGGGDVPPTGLTSTLTLQTLFTSRRARGRLFNPPPISSASLSGGSFVTSNAYWTAIQAWRTALLTLVSGAGHVGSGAMSDADLCVYSRTQWLATGEDYLAPVISIRANTQVHYLRSRAI